MTNIKGKGFECTMENNIQVVVAGVKKLISENSGIEMTIELESLQNQDCRFFMKMVECFEEDDFDIHCFSESELWSLVENINEIGKDDVEMSLDKLELCGLLKYEYHEDENEELCYVVWIEGINNYNQSLKTTENRKTS
jgi:hypothetical protein